MLKHSEINQSDIGDLISEGSIIFGGNLQAKIYGTLKCKPGKRLDKSNRVFFGSEEEAIHHGFRPCGICMRNEYKKWKNETI